MFVFEGKHLLHMTSVCHIYFSTLPLVCLLSRLLDKRDPHCMLIIASHVKEFVAGSQCSLSEQKRWHEVHWWPSGHKTRNHWGFVGLTVWAKTSDRIFVFVHSMINLIPSGEDTLLLIPVFPVCLCRLLCSLNCGRSFNFHLKWVGKIYTNDSDEVCINF